MRNLGVNEKVKKKFMHFSRDAEDTTAFCHNIKKIIYIRGFNQNLNSNLKKMVINKQNKLYLFYVHLHKLS